MSALTAEQGKLLLKIARRAIRHYMETGETLRPDESEPVFREKRGAFVTLKMGDELRGCIGYPLPYKPLAETVAEMAVAAASQDYRFEPLQPEDLDRVNIEVSVLGLPERVRDTEAVEVGRHGIIVTKGSQKGLLLPQVAEEQGWDRETFLRHGCLKAGLGPEEWRTGAGIEVFTAEVFTE